MLLVTIVEMNLSDLVFSASLQFLAFGSNSLLDKANFVAVNLVLFGVVWYSLSCYCIVYAAENKKYSKGLIVYLNYKETKSYFF